MGNGWALYSDPEGTPHPMKEPSFDSLYGFPNGRKERGKVGCNSCRVVSVKVD
jgi:hypothetical protein